MKLAGVLQNNMVAVDVEQLEPAADESQSSTKNAAKQPIAPVAIVTPVEEALMASESLRTLESPETSNVLAAEGSPERRKRKQLVGRDVGAQASVEVSHLHRLLLDFPEQIGL